MGRVKIKIKTLDTSPRQATYAKKKNGILKKAKELSILCETDILLVMFSPLGKPSLACGQRGVEETVTRYAQLTPQERANRQLETLEALKKNFKKFDHDVNIQTVLGASKRMEVECLSDQIMQLKTELEETQLRLSAWTESNCERLAAPYGVLLKMDDRDIRFAGVGRARMLIETTLVERISESVEAEIAGKVFEIGLCEDCCLGGCEIDSPQSDEEEGNSDGSTHHDGFGPCSGLGRGKLTVGQIMRRNSNSFLSKSLEAGTVLGGARGAQDPS